MKKCTYCGKDGAKLVCGGCAAILRVRYCSKECQKADWPSHKQLCKATAGVAENGPYSIVASDGPPPPKRDDPFIHIGKTRKRCFYVIKSVDNPSVGIAIVDLLKIVDASISRKLPSSSIFASDEDKSKAREVGERIFERAGLQGMKDVLELFWAQLTEESLLDGFAQIFVANQLSHCWMGIGEWGM